MKTHLINEIQNNLSPDKIILFSKLCLNNNNLDKLSSFNIAQIITSCINFSNKFKLYFKTLMFFVNKFNVILQKKFHYVDEYCIKFTKNNNIIFYYISKNCYFKYTEMICKYKKIKF